MLAFPSDDWGGVARVLVVGPLAYAALVLVLRATGKRTLSKMNAFDLIVTVALGSALATTILSNSTTLVEGVTAMVLLVLLQFSVTWLSVRSPRFQSMIKAQPALLLHRGEAIPQAMIEERVTEEEILAAARSNGMDSIGEACSVVLETDGSLTVLSGRADGTRSTLSNVATVTTAGFPRSHLSRSGD